MNMNLADIGRESAASDREASSPRVDAQQGPEREWADRIADADKAAMQRLFQDAFRSHPSRRDL
jgi:hypothetical protein